MSQLTLRKGVSKLNSKPFVPDTTRLLELSNSVAHIVKWQLTAVGMNGRAACEVGDHLAGHPAQRPPPVPGPGMVHHQYGIMPATPSDDV
jgi:hypothetical protein